MQSLSKDEIIEKLIMEMKDWTAREIISLTEPLLDFASRKIQENHNSK